MCSFRVALCEKQSQKDVVIQKDVLVYHNDVFNNMTADKKKILKTATHSYTNCMHTYLIMHLQITTHVYT